MQQILMGIFRARRRHLAWASGPCWPRPSCARLTPLLAACFVTSALRSAGFVLSHAAERLDRPS
jgi:hypothetical protein